MSPATSISRRLPPTTGFREYAGQCWRVLALLVLAKLFVALPASAHPASNLPTIRIASAGWGDTEIQDLQLVLAAAASELGSHFPGRQLGTIDVVPGETNPTVLYAKGPNGEYTVRLSARDSRWYQFVYQFSHELCHIYSNFDNKASRAGEMVSHNQWFEESVCEAAALYTLRKMAARWEIAPPAEKWAGYAPTFLKFAGLLLNEPHRQLPPSFSLAAWFQENQQDLHANPYLRDKDEVVSNLLLPLFERNPDGWGAIGYLNADKADSAKSFAAYLEAWCRACPAEYRRLVETIMAMFGTAQPSETLAAAN